MSAQPDVRPHLPIRDILRQYWGYPDFRGIQEQVILSALSGKDTLALMPTGGGKSICFQVPALARPGLCLVISPLISLIQDQVLHLRERGIKAEAIYSGMHPDDIARIIDNCILSDIKFLYIAPERLQSPLFQAKLPYFQNISLICVDEAHCISQWGYDFRPSYRQIGQLRTQLNYRPPLLALTATATPTVVKDIQLQLGFAQPNVISMSFERKNIAYVVRHTEDKASELVHILRALGFHMEAPGNPAAIVYTRSRQATEELANMLNSEGIKAAPYHAGLTDTERTHRQHRWTDGYTPVMVATNAFGMGIDKSNVRLVIHYHIPDSLEAYFQEAGRAGRDGDKAYAVLLVSPTDATMLRRRVSANYPDLDYVRQTYENVCCHYQIGIGEGKGTTHRFDIQHFSTLFKQFPLTVDSALKLLSNAGYIQYQTDNHRASRLQFTIGKKHLTQLDHYQPETDKLITALLRTYTGLFADYQAIDETTLSQLTGLSAEDIYERLKYLTHEGVVSYIPQNSSPTITFTQERIDTPYVQMPTAVYLDRKQAYIQRIEAVVEYATGHPPRCRSQQLLRYFGQRNAPRCGQCDVCLRQ